ncbi:serine/threonine protein kinase [Luteibacter aegosomatis]|uniref:serine/threonine-protein kinase n=1 Tax=Luteibacter aegosomatis TaxID=2911537 RepID=UPI001FF84828|nr:serine/threonine-protein kinase [Luteibacter aegosomatis]UPG84767.1 serine/threonine protein kinase [Luteibacter aegosomatis]
MGRNVAGRYRLMRELGRGGMGVVYLARDARRVEAGDAYPYVALKLLHDRWRGDSSARDVFRRQALRMCRIATPAVVRLYDLDRDVDDPFATMEYVRGVDLRRAMKAGVSRDTAWAWIRRLGNALTDMHEGGWVHADLKPANVMVDARGSIRLLDAAVVDSGALTPAYASPSRRKGACASFEDDVYAFACMTYELLAGRRPFDDGGPTRLAGVGRRAWKALRDTLECTARKAPWGVRELTEALRP